MNPFRSDLPSDAFEKDALGGFRRRKTCEVRFPTVGGCIARGEEHAAAVVDHLGYERPCDRQQRFDIDRKVPLQVGRIDIEIVAERPADGVVDDDIWHADIGHGLDELVTLDLVRQVSGHCDGAVQFTSQRFQALLVPSVQQQLVTILGEPLELSLSRCLGQHQ